MRPGCPGCLGLMVLLVLVALSVGGAVGAFARLLAEPRVSTPPSTAADGARAQHKLFDLARQPRRERTITLTEAEVNALLDRHLVEARGMRLTAPSARLIGDDRLVLDARSRLRQLLDETSLGALADVLPERWQTRPIWVHVGARLRVGTAPRRQLRIEVDEFAVGRQRLPTPLLRLLLDPAAVGLLQWVLPDYVERVAIEPGQVVIQVAPPH